MSYNSGRVHQLHTTAAAGRCDCSSYQLAIHYPNVAMQHDAVAAAVILMELNSIRMNL
jgi:hypothetical protein